jgi:uncharacterized membrane-anchored protein
MGRHTQLARRVPEIIVLFWVVKILTTGMGEATSDFFVHRVGLTNTPALLGVAFVAGVVLAISLALQFAAGRYVAWRYWFAVTMVSVFGTMAADGVHVQLGVPYAVSSAVFAVLLAVIFALWYASEKTLSIHSIDSVRREGFYWAVVLVTFALGTATGDWTALSLNLGFLTSGVLFAVLFAVPAVGYRWFRLNEVVAFWFAYVVTRPLGASFADWVAVPPSRGGLGFGYGTVSITLTILIVGCVAYLAATRRDVPKENLEVSRPPAADRLWAGTSEPSG